MHKTFYFWLDWSLTPEIHHAADVEEGEDDGEEDLEAGDEAGEHEERRHEDAGERQQNVPVQLVHYDLKEREKMSNGPSTKATVPDASLEAAIDDIHTFFRCFYHFPLVHIFKQPPLTWLFYFAGISIKKPHPLGVDIINGSPLHSTSDTR